MKKRADGRYRKKVMLPDGTTKYIYGKSQAEVNSKSKDLILEASTGVDVDDNTLFGDWAQQWFLEYKQGLREHTLLSYRNSYNNHIRNKLAAMPLKSIKPVNVKSVMNEVSGMSEDLQRKVLITMNQIFNTAIENRKIIYNPCAGIKIVKHATDARIKVLDAEQKEQLIRNVCDDRAKLFVALGLYCGLRREESLGLQWSSIDFKNKTLHVRRATTFIKNQPDQNHSLKSKAANRKLPIPDQLVEMLEEARKSATSVNVITSANGEEMTLQAYKNLWRKVTDAVDFDVTSHMLRHTYCTMLFKAGVDLRMAQYLMGHSDIKTTAEIYTHIEKSEVKKSADKIQTIFNRVSKGCQTERIKKSHTNQKIRKA